MVETHPGAVGTEYEHSAPVQRRQRSTRLLYDADDAVIAEFFAYNTPKSQALRDLIYLFAIEHGNNTDVSQQLRSHLVSLAGLGPGGGAQAAAPATRATAAPNGALNGAVNGTANDAAHSAASNDTASAPDTDTDAGSEAEKATEAAAPAQQPKKKKQAAAPAAKTSTPQVEAPAEDNTVEAAAAGTDTADSEVEEPGVGQQQMSSDFDFAAILGGRRESRDKQ